MQVLEATFFVRDQLNAVVKVEKDCLNRKWKLERELKRPYMKEMKSVHAKQKTPMVQLQVLLNGRVTGMITP